MSRAQALELIALSGSLDADSLPPVDSPLTWCTRVTDVGFETDVLLSAMEELRDERWVRASVTPVVGAAIADVTDEHVDIEGAVLMTCVFRRLSFAEAAALQQQAAPMVVVPNPPGRR